MKRSSYFILLVTLCFVFSSCVTDPYNYQERLVRNRLSDNIVVVTPKEIAVAPDSVCTVGDDPHFVSIKESYDETDRIDFPITIRFNDTVSMQYTLQDTFAKSTCNLSCYEIDNHYWKWRSKEQRITYTVDEQDYHNALVKCGYLTE